MLITGREVEIDWGDCDPAGIVFYPRYFALFDASTAYLFERALGCKKIVWTRKYGIVGIPIVDTGARFMVTSHFGDIVHIETQVKELRRSSFDVEHRVMKDGVTAVEAHETRVWAARHPEDPDRIKGEPIPAEVVAALSDF